MVSPAYCGPIADRFVEVDDETIEISGASVDSVLLGFDRGGVDLNGASGGTLA